MSPILRVKVYNIQWDTDGEEIDLPDSMIVEVENEDEAIDKVSDKTGWCIKSALIKVEEK